MTMLTEKDGDFMANLKTSHQLAKFLLSLPDCPLDDSDGDRESISVGGAVAKYTNDEMFSGVAEISVQLVCSLN